MEVVQVEGNAWFGGGCDLTPNYLEHSLPDGSTVDLMGDLKEFHVFWQSLCNKYEPLSYDKYKKW